MKKASVLIFGIAVVAITLVALVIFPEYTQEPFFWKRAFWLVFLVFLNWSAATFIFFKVDSPKHSTVFGAMPGVSTLVFLYSVLSLGLLAGEIWKLFPWSSGVYLAIQIAIGAVAAILVLLMCMAAMGAKKRSANPDLWSKKVLIQSIQDAQRSLPPEYAKDVGLLLERIEHAVPPVNSLNSVAEYKKLMAMAQSLNQQTECITIKNTLENMKETVERC